MKLAHLITLPLTVAFGLSLSCSDPPTPPAQAAVAITIGVGAGACRIAGGEITTPPDKPGNVGEVSGALSCNLQTAGCSPDAHVVVQGDPNTTVTCSVAPNGASFDVSVSVISGSRMSFSASGSVNTDGGALAVYEFDQSTQATLSDPACAITILNNLGTVKKGAIWARFNCSNFTDPTAAGGTSCNATGEFIFENCGG
jgi:hypothetical protein